MAVTDEIVSKAGDITWHKNWRTRVAKMYRIGDRYVRNEARRYYTDGRGGYYYRPINEADMHRGK